LSDRVRVAALIAAVAAATSAAASAAQPRERTVWDGIYTEAQAKRGEGQYQLSCGYCHKDDLSGGFFDDGTGRAPALAGLRAFNSSFEQRWGNLTVRDMLVQVGSIMPPDDPAGLPVQTYIDIFAFLFSRNDVPAGSEELPADLQKLEALRIIPKPAR
jgi:S-disulfanyl-L-cysteine oxidoreductase SoxD